MRVALLSPSYWPEVRRGSERFVHDLAHGLISRGHHPTVITSHPGPPQRGEEDGLPVVRLWRPPEGPLRRRGHQPHLTHLPFSYLALSLGGYDLAHAVYPTDALVAARWSRRTGRPAVVSLMGLPTRASVAGVRGRVGTIRRIAGECSATVTLSQAAAEAFKGVLGVDTRVITPGVELEHFAPGGQRHRRPTIFCPAAAGDPRKRLAELLEAFDSLRRRRPQARLLLARPRDSEAPPPVAARTGEGVWFIDVDASEHLLNAYRSAWVTALPSVEEAFGLVLVESMACGTPVVARADGGAGEIIDSERVGMTFNGDSQQLASSLERALELTHDQTTREACRRRAEDFPLGACVDSYVALYQEVLGRA